MAEISGIGGPLEPRPVARGPHTGRSAGTQGRSTQRSDTVEISAEGARRAEQASYLDRLKEVDEVRHERINAIKSQIENRTYDIEGNFGKALDGLLGDIGL